MKEGRRKAGEVYIKKNRKRDIKIFISKKHILKKIKEMINYINIVTE